MKEMGRQIKGCLSSTTEGLACVESSQVLQTMRKILEENPEVQGELDFVLRFKGEEKGNSLVFHASIAGDTGLILVGEVRSRKPCHVDKIKKDRKGLDKTR